MRHKLKQPVPVSAIVELLGAEVKDVSGPVDREIFGIDSLPDPAPGSLAFCKFSDDRLEAALACKAAALIVPDSHTVDAGNGPTLLVSSNPRLAFIRAAALLYAEKLTPGIHPTATVDSTATIDPTAQIGAGAVIGPRCSVGAGTVIYPNVVLQRDVKIGRNCKIDSNSALGGEGFGFERAPTGELVNFPHNGAVVIGDNVELGAGVCVDRGTINDTIIEEGVRVDNLVQVAHNVRIGKHSVVICHTTLCGSVQIGEQAWISPGCQILNGAKIGDRARIGMGSVVTKDVPTGEFWAGNPARKVPTH